MAPKKTKHPLLEIATEADSGYTSQPMTSCNEKQVIDPHTIKLKMGPIGDKDPLVVREKNVKIPADVFKNLKYAEAQKRSFVFDLTDLDGAFKVIKVLEVGSKRLYTVEIFGLNEDKILAACQCPDYRHNEIAYCHHIAGIERLCAASEQVKTKLKFHNQNLDYFPLKVIHYNPSSKKLVTFGSGDLIHKTVSAIEQEKEPPPIVVDIKLMEEVERIRKQQPYEKDLLDDDVELYDYQQEVFYRLIAAKRAICSLSMGAGKAQPLTAKILTPNGWTTMGQIKVGDVVVGSYGKPTKVTGVFPQGIKEIFEITLENGASTKCCDEHLWQVKTFDGVPLTINLKGLKERLLTKTGTPYWVVPTLAENKNTYVPLVKIESNGTEEAQCISVEAEDHLYVTDDYIVTHNTLSAICCYSWILRHVREDSKMLVIAPNSLLTQWEDEINRVKPNIKTKILKKDYDIHDWQDNTQVGIINYQMAQRYYEVLAKNKIDVVVADEIQFVKNSESKTWKALKKLSFEYFFALTGTPVENGLEDFYSIMSLIEPTLLGPKWKFDFTYHTVTELKPLKIVYGGVKDIDILKSKVENRLFSYTKLKLPPRTDHDVRINLETPEANSEANYMEMVARFASKFSNRPPTFQELCILQGFLLRARQSCNSAELITKQPLKHTPAKVAKFVELVTELTQVQKRKVVVFSEWTQMIAILKDQLTALNIDSVDFTGDQNIKQRKQAVKSFSTDPNCLVFFASDAGGTGLDGLQKVSDAVIHIELPWNPAKLDQRTGRIYRLGQKNPVDVYYFISKGTLEESIESALFRKRSVRQALMEGTNIATNADDKSFMATVLSNLREKKLNDQSV